MTFDLTSDQVRAIEAMDAWFAGTARGESSFFSLRGYAGVGKTWLTGHWLRGLLNEDSDLRVVVVAPTNKAVDVLRVKCGHLPRDQVTFRTLDSYLGFRIKRDDDWQMQRSQHQRADEDVPDLVLCDEASMVKEEYHGQLRAKRVPVLYVGDPAQLQPVGEEASVAFSLPEATLMTQVVRQAAGNPIIELATYLRECIDTHAGFILQDLRQFASAGDRRVSFTGKHNVHDWAEAALDKGMDCRILAFTNAAVYDHNATMHRRRYPDAPLFGVGELALVNEAFELPDDELLTNGEILRVVACERADDIEGVVVYEVRAMQTIEGTERELRLLVAADADKAFKTHRELTDQIYTARRAGDMDVVNSLVKRRRPLNKLAPLRHAYACTVHKSQGSTYDVAFVDFSDIYRSRDMRARLMYVSATRPSQFLVIAH